MIVDRQTAERVVDQVWSRALDKIVKGSAVATARPVLGDDIDLFVPQVVTTSLLGANPAFARLLYSSGDGAAKRNAYFIIRRLGMPADFFWKFDFWDDERAFTTLKKVMDRIFASLMSRHKAGLLELRSVDVERSRFELSFGGCVECSGLASSQPICFFHAGVFSGILDAMLDRDFDAVEEECAGAGGTTCRFKIGLRTDRAIAVPFDAWMSSPASNVIDVARRATVSLEGQRTRDIGNLVDIGYYQLLLASSFLPNLEMLAQACFGAGQEIGRVVAPLLRQKFSGNDAAVISEFYSYLRHMKLEVVDAAGAINVRIEEAPEALGPLANTTLVPFLCGELESLLSALMETPVRYQSNEHGADGLLVRFTSANGSP